MPRPMDDRTPRPSHQTTNSTQSSASFSGPSAVPAGGGHILSVAEPLSSSHNLKQAHSDPESKANGTLCPLPASAALTAQPQCVSMLSNVYQPTTLTMRYARDGAHTLKSTVSNGVTARTCVLQEQPGGDEGQPHEQRQRVLRQPQGPA